jgi:MarR family transcriptional regulator, organic hydroperoxide resistance regulator
LDLDSKDKVQSIEYLLRRICFSIKKKGRTILEEFNITPPQFDALQYLVNNGDMTISELSSKLFLAPSTITDLVDRMEKSGLVERIRSNEDRRLVKVRVLKEGFDLIDHVILLRCQFIKDATEELSLKEKEDFIKYLEILNKSSLSIDSNK